MSELGNKEVMAKNIKRLMTRYGKDRIEVCKDLGFKYTTFADWINAKTYPRIDKIEMMANYFNVSKAELVEIQSEQTRFSKGVVINVYGSVAAGVPIEAIEDIVDTEEITQELARTGTFFGLRIKGDSMEPKMSTGDVVIVRKQDDAESGDIVIATVNGDEATCKRLKKYEHGIALLSTNPNYDPMYFSNKEIEEKPVKIIGKVVELRAKF